MGRVQADVGGTGHCPCWGTGGAAENRGTGLQRSPQRAGAAAAGTEEPNKCERGLRAARML